MTFHEMTLSNVKKKKRNSLNPLSRHASLLKKSSATGFDTWLDEHNRRNLSVPDLHKLKKEWDEYQQSDMTPNNKITDTKMQVKKKAAYIILSSISFTYHNISD
jgi:hypothetical protein